MCRRKWFWLLTLGCALAASLRTLLAFNQSTLGLLEDILSMDAAQEALSTSSSADSSTPTTSITFSEAVSEPGTPSNVTSDQPESKPSMTATLPESDSRTTTINTTLAHSEPSKTPLVVLNTTSIAATTDDDSSSTNNSLYACRLGNETVTLSHPVPHFLLIGAQKGGTSALYSLLKKHPNVVSSMRFEPHFFDFRGGIPYNIAGVEAMSDERICQLRHNYSSSEWFPMDLVQNKSAQGEPLLVFEKTPDYLPHPNIPMALDKICPWKPKLVVSLRHPVDRVYSFFKMVSHYKNSKLTTFEAYVEDEMKTLRRYGFTTAPTFSSWNATYDETTDGNHTTDPSLSFALPEHQTMEQRLLMPRKVFGNKLFYGCYGQQLHSWAKLFPLNDTLKVVSYDAFAANQSAVYTEIVDFIGAPRHELDDDVLQKNQSPNAGAQKKDASYHAPMSSRLREYLLRFYQPYNAELADLLGEEWRGIWET